MSGGGGARTVGGAGCRGKAGRHMRWSPRIDKEKSGCDFRQLFVPLKQDHWATSQTTDPNPSPVCTVLNPGLLCFSEDRPGPSPDVYILGHKCHQISGFWFPA